MRNVVGRKHFLISYVLPLHLIPYIPGIASKEEFRRGDPSNEKNNKSLLLIPKSQIIV